MASLIPLYFVRRWADPTMNCLPVKSQGRTAMTSDFVTILDGPLRYTDEVWEEIKEKEEVQEEIRRYGEDRARKAGVILDVATEWLLQRRIVFKGFYKGLNPPPSNNTT